MVDELSLDGRLKTNPLNSHRPEERSTVQTMRSKNLQLFVFSVGIPLGSLHHACGLALNKAYNDSTISTWLVYRIIRSFVRRISLYVVCANNEEEEDYCT
jgi:hypothetical protein